LQAKDQEIAELKAKSAELSARLAAIEERLAHAITSAAETYRDDSQLAGLQ